MFRYCITVQRHTEALCSLFKVGEMFKDDSKQSEMEELTSVTSQADENVSPPDSFCDDDGLCCFTRATLVRIGHRLSFQLILTFPY